jgi:hypothetical protein
MDNSVIVPLINDDCRLVHVIYEEGGIKSLMKTLDLSITVDDLVVVQSGTRWEMTVAKVAAVDVDINFETECGVKWVVHKVDATGFERIIEMEKEAIDAVQAAEKKRKRDELRKSVMAHHEDQIKGLQIAKMDDGVISED